MKTTALALLLLASGAAAVAAEATPPASTGYVPCKVQQKIHAEFPLRLLYQGVVQGESSAILEIDPSGHIADQLVTQYTRPEFADEMMRTIQGWGFEPGRIDGRPITSVLNVSFEFTVNGVLVYEKQFNQAPADSILERRFAYYPHGQESLDQKPVAVDLPAPIYPSAWIRDGRRGSVTIRFFIDETGKARLPEIVAESDNLLANAAVAAVKQWRFQPPTHRGHAVLARAEQIFEFHPPVAKAD